MADAVLMKFTFSSPGKLVFGPGAAKKAGKELEALGSTKAMLVTDDILGGSEIVAKVKNALGDRLVLFYDKAVPDSDLAVINQGATLAREAGVDGIVSVGGGSSIDTAKAIGVLLTKGAENISDHLNFNQVGGKLPPHVAIPTTTGTGSECTGVAVVKDHEKGVKRLIVDNNLIPPVAILDPEMVRGLPAQVTASTGMDAMTHAVEAMLSTRHMPPSDALAAGAIELLMKYLARAVQDGNDMEARGMTLIAAAQAGMAFQNSYVGIVHAMAHALGGQFGVPHGVANALLLAPCMEYNLSAAVEQMAAVARAMGIPKSGDREEDAKTAIDRIRAMNKILGLPIKLAEVGVKEEGLKACADIASVDASIYTNPRRAQGPEEILELYKKVMK